ncbi:DUF3871 family protein [Flaviaesturariibacter terrae]
MFVVRDINENRKLDKLSGKKGPFEHFKSFIGFRNSACCNLCVSTDGLLADIRATSKQELYSQIYELLCRYNALEHLTQMQGLNQLSINERQFAQLIGRCRLYQHLSPEAKKDIPELHFGDSQVNQICKDYYRDKSFCRDENGGINLWKVYNLFTGANKSSYIDGFLERASNANQFVNEIAQCIKHRSYNWFLA